MNYPRNPPGLSWDDCDSWMFNEQIANALRDADYVPLATDKSQETAPTKRSRKDRKPRTYASKYIGVGRWKRGNGGWYGQWPDPVTKWKQGPVRETQLEAAWDRARALGLPDVELR